MPATLVGCFPALYAFKTRKTRKNGSLENGVSDSDSHHLTTGHEHPPRLHHAMRLHVTASWQSRRHWRAQSPSLNCQ